MPPASAALFPDHLRRVGVWRKLDEAHEHALVVLAMGMDCSVHRVDDGYELLTAHADAAAAKHELDLYAAEQAHVHVHTEEDHLNHPAGILWIMTWITALVIVFSQQGEHPEITDRFANSSLGLMVAHEWWRPFTSLFLHADLIHLAGNVLIGGLFCLLVAKSLGAWRAWLLIFSAGTIGNALNAAFRYPEAFEAIGASTATFAALGILVGLAIAEGARGAFGRMRGLAIPFLGGLILFGLLGTSGERTDIGGHAWGGLCGMVSGAIAGAVRWGQQQPRVTKS